jgi:hypothetical protein
MLVCLLGADRTADEAQSEKGNFAVILLVATRSERDIVALMRLIFTID